MAGEQGPLEELNRRIQIDPKVVTDSDVNNAFDQEEKNIEQMFKAQGDKASEAEKSAHILKLKDLRAQMIKELDDLRNNRTTTRGKALNEARLAREILQLRMAGEAQRHADRQGAYSAAEKKAGQIDDYEGVDALHNKTRDTFQGYLAALEQQDPAQAVDALQKAKTIYQKQWYQDNVLNYDEMLTGLDMAKYSGLLDKYELTDEGRGLMIGYLSVADKNFKDQKQKDAYKKYVLDTLSALQDKGTLKAESYLEKNKREEQRKTLEAIMSPKEWKELEDKRAEIKVKNAFKDLNDAVAKLRNSLKYEPADNRVKSLISKTYDDIKISDEAEITYASDKVRAEASTKLNTELTNAKNGLVILKKRLQDAAGKNMKQVRQADIDAAQRSLTDTETSLATILLVAGAPLAGVVTQADKLKGASDSFAAARGKIEGIEKAVAVVPPTPGTGGAGGGPGGVPGGGPGTGGTTPERPPTTQEWKDKWANAKSAESRYKSNSLKVAPGNASINSFDNAGNPSVTIPGGTEVTLVSRTGNQLSDGTLFIKVRYQNKEVWVDESKLMVSEGGAENLDIDKFLKDKNLSEKKEKDDYEYKLGALSMEPLAPGSNLNKSGNSEVDAILKMVLDKYGAKVPTKVLKEVNKVLTSLAFLLPLNRTRTQLDEKYSKDYLPKLRSNIAYTIGKSETGPETGNVKLDEDVAKILGTEWPILDYAAGFNAVAAYIRDPEKFRDGAMFNLPFNGLQAGCSLKYENGTSGRVLFTANVEPKYTQYFDSPQDFMRNLNKGYVVSWMTRRVMETKANYSAYRDLVGKTDFVDKGEFNEQGETWPVHMEFDWEGILDDPDVYVKFMPFGVVKYAIQWQHVGTDGKNWRVGFASSVDDFFAKMKHCRDWGNKYGDIKDERMDTEKKREKMYEQISNPYTFTDKGARIGNTVKFATGADHTSTLVLDWGGGYDANSKANARVNMWVREDGMISFNVENTGLNAAEASGVAVAGTDVVAQLERIREKAGKGKAPMVMAR